MCTVYFDLSICPHNLQLYSEPTISLPPHSYSLVVDVVNRIWSLVKADHVWMRSFYLLGPGKPTSSHTLPK